MKSPIDALSRPQWGTSLRGMSDQTSEAFAYIRRKYNDVKGRVELQRHVVAQLHMVEAEAGEAEAALNALLVLGLLAKVARRQCSRVLNIAC